METTDVRRPGPAAGAAPESATSASITPSGPVAATVGLGIGVALIALAMLLPLATGWDVHTHTSADRLVPPLHARGDPKLGLATPLALLLGVTAIAWFQRACAHLRWRPLLAASSALTLAWMATLALVDGVSGLTRSLGNSHEYLRTGRTIDDIASLLAGFVDRVPLDATDNWPTHVAGHPPGALLVFVGLDRAGLGGDLAAAVVVLLIAASLPAAVASTLSVLGAEGAARRVLPFLVVGPAAIWLAVSADAIFAAVAAWGLCLLAVAGTAQSRRTTALAAVASGLLLGASVMLSYGLVLLGVLALAVLRLGGRWASLPIAAAAALLVVISTVPWGFRWWEGFLMLRERYWDGLASARPGLYWTWANLAAFLLSAGLVLAAAVGTVVARQISTRQPPTRRASPVSRGDEVVTMLGGAALVSVLLATVSQMSRAEVERIWLPFLPWALVLTALVPGRWRGPLLVAQVVQALLLQHLLYTSW